MTAAHLPTSFRQRWEKAQKYLKKGDISGLFAETKQFLQWKFNGSIRPGLQQNAIDASAQIADTSQHGEVQVLWELIHDDPQRFLVEVGAHDGKHLSNSWPLIQSGWNAILIEPLPKVFRQLSDNHRDNANVICLNMACSDQSGAQPLFIGSDGDEGTMATLCTDDNQWFEMHRTNESVMVEVETLTHILANNSCPKEFSLLLVDAEGMDYEVLLGLDFEMYQPRIIVTEEYESNLKKHENKYRLLEENGYNFHTLVGCNTFWVKQQSV